MAFGGNNTSGPIDVATALTAHGGPMGRMDFESETFIAHTLRGEGFDASEDGTGRGTPIVPVNVALRGRDGGAAIEMGDDVAFTLRASQGGGDKPHVLVPTIAFHGSQDPCVSGDVTHPVGRNSGLETCVLSRLAVRRLTPRECERLQGFPDDYTLIPWRKGMVPDGPRYKALGNSMAVPVMRWIGQRIAAVEAQQLTVDKEDSRG
jgi:DNA (cytosine-5)-methyltransferase 1